MFFIIATLLALQEVSNGAADRVQAFFNPALNWIQRWLPLFYVPTLVVLPVAVQGIPGGSPIYDCYESCAKLTVLSALRS